MLKKDILFDVLKKDLFKNIASLGVIQLANNIIPIIIIPIVVRSLGVDFFGKVSYAQNIIAYLTVIINYGFEYSATQDIAINRHDNVKVQNIFFVVIKFKFKLLLLSYLVLGLLYLVSDKIQQEPLLYLAASLINVGFVFFPTWFFQGIEEMGRMSLFNFTIKLLGAILIFICVHSSSDYIIYIFILSISYVVVGILSFFYVIIKYNFKLSNLGKKIKQDSKIIRKGFPIFLNNVFVYIYASIGITIMGIYLPENEIGIYSGSHKIIMAIMMLTSMPVNVALFPVISRKFNESLEKGWSFFKKALLIVSGLALLVSLFTYLLSPLIVQVFLGKQFGESAILLQILSVLPFLVIISSMLTVQGMYGLQMQKYAPYLGLFLVIISSLANLASIPKYGIYGAAFSWIIANIFEIIFVLILLKRKYNEN